MREKLGEDTLVTRIEVLDEYVGHPCIDREGPEQSPEGLQTARRRTYADDGERVPGCHGTTRAGLFGDRRTAMCVADRSVVVPSAARGESHAVPRGRFFRH